MPRTSPRATAAPAVRGRDVSLDEAITAAADLLGNSRCAVIAGLATDIAGTKAAIELARRLDGVIDHLHAGSALRELDVVRQAGWIVTTPLQARARADIVLFVGPGADADDYNRYDTPPALFAERARHVLRLCAGDESPHRTANRTVIGDDPAQLPLLLGVLRAIVGGRPVRADAPWLEALRDCASRLTSAAFGVAVWSAAALDALSIEMLCGLIDDLNAKTRFAGLPLALPGNAAGVAQASAWACGFPLRIGFMRKHIEHDPWQFDTTRMIDSGEADAAMWISAFAPEAPPWRRAVPCVALAVPGARFRSPPEVSIVVGNPGRDHPAVLFDSHLATLVCKTAAEPSSAPSVADTVQRITAALRPC